MADVEERLKGVLAKILKVDPATIGPDSHFARDLGMESLQSIELVAAIEEEFDIDMDEDAALQVQTVGNAIEFIAKYL